MMAESRGPKIHKQQNKLSRQSRRHECICGRESCRRLPICLRCPFDACFRPSARQRPVWPFLSARGALSSSPGRNLGSRLCQRVPCSPARPWASKSDPRSGAGRPGRGSGAGFAPRPVPDVRSALEVLTRPGQLTSVAAVPASQCDHPEAG